MRNVMQKAQELADAIRESDIYLHMKAQEEEVQDDEEAAEAVNDLMRARQRVEELLTRRGMDPEELKQANEDMKQAEIRMNANEKVAKLKKARKEFTGMMDSVNLVLRVVITGEIRSEDFSAGAEGSCRGNCSGCNGCG